jgi:hypothetical protein
MKDYHGHMTLEDGSHIPLTAADAEAFWKEALAEKAARAAAMPTEQDAIRQMSEAYHRLKELGWNSPDYCPKDGSEFDIIEAGSTGIHRCAYWGTWPTGTYNVFDSGDVWPSRPTLYRVTEAQIANREEQRRAFASSREPTPSLGETP